MQFTAKIRKKAIHLQICEHGDLVLSSSILVNFQSLPRFKHGSSNNSYIYYVHISYGDRALMCVTAVMILMWGTGQMEEGEQSTREQMRPLVCMSLEDMERSVSTATVAAFQTHQDCRDVMYIPDSSEVMQSIYIYISNDTTSGKQ